MDTSNRRSSRTARKSRSADAGRTDTTPSNPGMHEAVRRERERAEEYLRLVGAIVVAIGADERVTLINRRGQEVLGGTEDRIVGLNWFDHFVPPEVRDATRMGFRQMMADRVEVMEYYENPVLTLDGRRRLVAWHNTVLRDDSGVVTGTLSAGEDVTDERHMAEALEKSERLYRLLIESLDEGVFLHGIEPDGRPGRLMAVNEAACRYLGYTREELLRMSPTDFDTPESAALVPGVMDRLRERGVATWEGMHVTRDGRRIPVELTSHAIVLDGRPVCLTTARDLTARKKAERELFESRQMLRFILDNVPQRIFWKDQDLRYAGVNRPFADDAGVRDPADMIGKSDFDFVWSADAEKYRADDRQVMESGRPRVGYEELQHIGAGRTRWLRTSKVPLRDPAGRVVGVIGTYFDVNERKRQELRLARLNECLLSFGADPKENVQRVVSLCGELLEADAALFNRLDGDRLCMRAHWCTPPDLPESGPAEGRICHAVMRRASDEVTVIRNLPDTEFARTDAAVLLYGLRTYVGKAIRFNGENVGILCTLYRRDFEPADADLKLLEILASAIAVEERRQQAMQDVVRAKTEWERTFDSVPDLVSIIDLNHRIVRMNRAMAERLGTDGERIGCACHLCVHGTDNAPDYCPHSRTIRTGREESSEFFSEKFHGHFKVTTSPFRDTEGNITGTVHIARDITREKQLEEQFRQAQKMEAVGRLAGGVAHDFNNLLQAIQGFTELVCESFPGNDPRRQDLQEVLAAAGRARTLTQQLLAFSRRQILEPRILDLNTVVHESGKLLARLIGEDVRLERNLSADLWRVMADPSQMDQVLINLAVNARDAMPHGGVLTLGTRNVELGEDEAQQMTDARPGRFVCLSVSDNGTGMSDEVRSHLFEPFFTTKSTGKGTGLGLAMVYGAVRQHDGWIYVYTHPGLGTTFRIYLPARLEADAVPYAPPPKAPEPPPPGRGERILLVEDEPTVRALATRALEAAGYEVFAACGAEEARALFDSGHGCFHLLFCDVVLPGESGLALAEYMCDGAPSLSILLTSGYTDDRSRWAAIRARGIHFLQKPYSMNNMLRVVRDIIDHPDPEPDETGA